MAVRFADAGGPEVEDWIASVLAAALLRPAAQRQQAVRNVPNAAAAPDAMRFLMTHCDLIWPADRGIAAELLEMSPQPSAKHVGSL